MVGYSEATVRKQSENTGIEPPSHWALLVAGSRGYFNYRHQSDVCHAYQILHKFGFEQDKIVVMLYDDIAFAAQNPTPGVLINRLQGPNVYKNIQKDYTGDSITPENFIAVLSGNASAVRLSAGTPKGKAKVLHSGPNDRVFVYFSDHGGTGLVAFPDGRFLFAKDLIDTLSTMAKRKQFRELTFYMEACESGSMFEDLLPDNIRVFATTAANPDESSYACYFDAERGTYLGDEYSVAWMEDAESRDVQDETLQQQFEQVRNKTVTRCTLDAYAFSFLGPAYSLSSDSFRQANSIVFLFAFFRRHACFLKGYVFSKDMLSPICRCNVSVWQLRWVGMGWVACPALHCTALCSHAMEYGDMSIGTEPLSRFLVAHPTGRYTEVQRERLRGNDFNTGNAQQRSTNVQETETETETETQQDRVDARDVPLHVLRYRLDTAPSSTQKAHISGQIKSETSRRLAIDWAFRRLAAIGANEIGLGLWGTNVQPVEESMLWRKMGAGKITQWGCYKEAVYAFQRIWMEEGCQGEKVPETSDEYDPFYWLKYTHILANLCESGMPEVLLPKLISLACTAEPKVPTSIFSELEII